MRSGVTEGRVVLPCDPRCPPRCGTEMWPEGDDVRTDAVLLTYCKQTGGQIKGTLYTPASRRLTHNPLTIFSVTKYEYAEKQRGPHTHSYLFTAKCVHCHIWVNSFCKSGALTAKLFRKLLFVSCNIFSFYLYVFTLAQTFVSTSIQ